MRHNAFVGRGEARDLERRTLDVAGVRRGYWLARGPGEPPGTLLMVLRGSGTSGEDVATIFTGLCIRWRRGALRVTKEVNRKRRTAAHSRPDADIRITATTEALMRAEGEPAGAGRA